MSYLLREDGRTIAFTGDVMLDGAKLHTWFDTEWDYGFAAGIQALRKSVESTPRQVVSASVIEQANVILELIKFTRNFSH